MYRKLIKISQILGIFLLMLAEIGLLQWLGGAYSSGFGGQPDEAAHFVSAIMVHDFLGNLGAVQPMEFAQTFYLHYPKVAIGNWPPLLYAALGTWFLAFGVSRVSALVFIAVVAAVTATAIYAVGRKLLSPLAGLFAATLYVALPLVQESSAMVMTEHLVTLLIFLSTLQFARFAETRKTRDALVFGFIATAAILTRGSAWSLVLVPPLVILLTHDWRLMLNPRLWLSTLPVVILCVPWYALTRGMSKGAMTGNDPEVPFSFLIKATAAFPIFTFQAIGIVLSGLAVIGLWAVLIKPGIERSSYWAALVAMAIGILVIHSVIPAGLEARYMMQLLPSLLLLSAAGGQWIIGSLPQTIRVRFIAQSAVWLVTAAAVLVTIFKISDHIRNSGYESVASALMTSTQDVSKPAALLASDSIGEGSLIAAVAAAETRPRTILLRGSRILISEDWHGRDTRDRFGSLDELRKLLDSIPVHAVVVDESIELQWHRPYHDMIAQLMNADKSEWSLEGNYNVVRRDGVEPQNVSVFVRRQSAGSRLPSVIDMDKIRNLMQRD